LDLWGHLLGRFVISGSLVGFSILAYYYWPVKSSKQVQLALLLALGVVLQWFVWSIPTSDDVNRYLWEGRLVTVGVNPYEVPANDVSRSQWHDEVYEGMNHKGETTIYPPLSQWVFAGAVKVWEDLRIFKILSWFFVLACVPVLQSLLGGDKERHRWLPVFVLNPVNVFSFAGEGHFDSMMVFFILLAVWLVKRESRILAVAAILAAINIKIVALLLAPYFLWKLCWKDWWRFVLVTVFVIILPSLPFFEAAPQILKGVLRFGGDFTGNASIHPILAALTWHNRIAGVIGLLILCLGIRHFFFRKPSLEFAIYGTLGILLLVAPLVTFWYVAWLLPFAVLLGHRAAPVWWLSATVVGYYAAWWSRETTGEWSHPLWASLLQWIPVYCLLGWQFLKYRQNLKLREE